MYKNHRKDLTFNTKNLPMGVVPKLVLTEVDKNFLGQARTRDGSRIYIT